MPFNPQRLLAHPFADQFEDYDARATMFYALSVGLGADPLDRGQLGYVYEQGLRAFPAMAHVLAMELGWIFDPENGIDLPQLLHVESGMAMHRPLPPAGRVKSRLTIPHIFDRGKAKGAVLRFERDLHDASSGALLATVSGTFLLRGNGGFGGEPGNALPPAEIPDRAPDKICDLPTLPQAALLYRLNNDPNPLHADPDVARQAGFERPILHGACTYAVACHAFLRAITGYDGPLLRRFDARFSAPVFPGETIRTEFWELGPNRHAFRALALERNAVVLNNGLAEHH